MDQDEKSDKGTRASKPAPPPPGKASVRLRIKEPDRNLKSRQEWYSKRSGGRADKKS